MYVSKVLINRCLKNERLAQNELYQLIFSPLMNICMRYKNDYDTAGASLNSIFMKLLENLEEYDNERSFYSWMKRIAINLLIDEYRKHKREKEHLSYLDDLSSNHNGFHNHQGEEKLDADYLHKMINELPKVTAKVFNLYAIDGYKHREIAILLNINENTSKWHLHSARKLLKNKLELFNMKKPHYSG